MPAFGGAPWRRFAEHPSTAHSADRSILPLRMPERVSGRLVEAHCSCYSVLYADAQNQIDWHLCAMLISGSFIFELSKLGAARESHSPPNRHSRVCQRTGLPAAHRLAGVLTANTQLHSVHTLKKSCDSWPQTVAPHYIPTCAAPVSRQYRALAAPRHRKLRHLKIEIQAGQRVKLGPVHIAVAAVSRCTATSSCGAGSTARPSAEAAEPMS